jgi:hypothetical protein
MLAWETAHAIRTREESAKSLDFAVWTPDGEDRGERPDKTIVKSLPATSPGRHL